MFDALPDDFGTIHTKRQELISTVDFVEHIMDDQQHSDVPDRHKEDYMSVNVNALEEEILLKNLGSFKYDW